MKRSDSGDFCLLYIEPEDDKSAVFALVSEQSKPAVILLQSTGAQTRARVFQRPEDFSDLKHLRRQHDLTIFFVIAGNDYLHQLAARNGFPTYTSIDALGEALEEGRSSLAHSRAMAKNSPALVEPVSPTPPSIRLSPPVMAKPAPSVSMKKTVPLKPASSSSPQHAPVRVHTPTPVPASRHTTDPGTFAAPTFPLEPPRASGRRRQRVSRIALVVLVLLSLLVLGGGALGYFVFYAHGTPSASAVVAAPKVFGRVNFLSSEQVSETSNAGLNDEVELDLQGIQPPAPGDSFYAWLLGDQNSGDSTVIMLGKLTLVGGNAHLLYSGDAQHTNLLDITSRFLVTEESATITPVSPSPDYNTWRYYGEISQTPDPQDPDHFSYLDHLRHLLSSDPLLNSLELPGGLCNWFYRNTDKLLEWTVSARDQWDAVRDTGFAVRQTLRTLAYLDGLSFVAQDIPPGLSLPDTPHIASVGLINVQSGNQTPPGYIAHILRHLNGLISAPGSTLATRQVAAQIIEALSNVQQWLQKLRSDARQFVLMTNAQLMQPAALALLNDMVQQANNAYSGQIDPVSGAVHQGVSWIHAQAQSLATMDVYQYVQQPQTPEIVPTTAPFTMVQGPGRGM
ncbi:MAG TPA: hypothetical protein VIZ18_15970 [Ktedonobacteraceae bacterium]